MGVRTIDILFACVAPPPFFLPSVASLHTSLLSVRLIKSVALTSVEIDDRPGCFRVIGVAFTPQLFHPQGFAMLNCPLDRARQDSFGKFVRQYARVDALLHKSQ